MSIQCIGLPHLVSYQVPALAGVGVGLGLVPVAWLVVASGLVLAPVLVPVVVLVPAWHSYQEPRQLTAESPMVPQKFSSPC
jgi:hypothetical protein